MLKSLYIFFCFRLFLVSCDPSMVIVLTANEVSSLLTSKLEPIWTNSFDFTNFDAKRNFALGTLLAEKYPLLLKNIKPDEIFVQASNHSFSQSSLSAQIMGLFQQENSQNLTQDKLFLPFQDTNLLNEVFSTLQKYPQNIPNLLQLLKPKMISEEDDFLEVNALNCKMIFEEQYKRYFESNITNQKMSEFNKTIQKLKNLGYEISHVHGLAELGAILYQRHRNKEPNLNGIKYGSDLYQDAVFIFKWWRMYNLVGNSFERSLRLFHFYSNLDRWLKDESFKSTKLLLLSGYESLIYSILDAYGAVNYECLQAEKLNKSTISNSSCIFPDSGSQIIIEVYRQQGLMNPNNPTIKVLYNGSPIAICQSFECSLQEFSNQVSSILIGMGKNIYDEACDVPKIGSTEIEISPPVPVFDSKQETGAKNNSISTPSNITRVEFLTQMSRDLKISEPVKDQALITQKTTLRNCLILAIFLLASAISTFLVMIYFGKLKYAQKYRKLETHDKNHL